MLWAALIFVLLPSLSGNRKLLKCLAIGKLFFGPCLY
jgi:hypothetical protein